MWADAKSAERTSLCHPHAHTFHLLENTSVPLWFYTVTGCPSLFPNYFWPTYPPSAIMTDQHYTILLREKSRL